MLLHPRRSSAQRLDQLAELVGCRDRGEDRQGDAAGDEGAEPLLHLLWRAEDEHVLDQLPWRCSGRGLPVLRLPRRAHLGDLVAVAEPAIERRIDRDGDVGGEHEAGDRLDLLALAGEAEETTEELEPLRRAL